MGYDPEAEDLNARYDKLRTAYNIAVLDWPPAAACNMAAMFYLNHPEMDPAEVAARIHSLWASMKEKEWR